VTRILRRRHGQHVVSNENGDCHRACLSVLLDVPNGDHLPTLLPDLEDAERWLRYWGTLRLFLATCGLTLAHGQPKGPIWKHQPWMASVPSKNFEGSTHSIVMHHGGIVLFDPSPRTPRYDTGLNLLGEDVVLGGSWLEVADPSRLHRLAEFRREVEA
jgi:hypothetical protein